MGRVAWYYPASDGGLLDYLLELGGGDLVPVFMIQVILGDGAQINCISWALLASGDNPPCPALLALHSLYGTRTLRPQSPGVPGTIDQWGAIMMIN